MNSDNRSKPFFRISIMILWIGLCYMVAWAGAQVSPGIASPDWYNSLIKPSWNPPNWLFGPVWTILYTLMGISAWMVWKDHGFKGAKAALGFFFVQLLLNGLWSQIFFGMQQPGWAFFEIFFLLAAILATTYLFFMKNRIAGWLMVPYVLWIGFATALNGAIWVMN
jgi:translocator protein